MFAIQSMNYGVWVTVAYTTKWQVAVAIKDLLEARTGGMHTVSTIAPVDDLDYWINELGLES